MIPLPNDNILTSSKISGNLKAAALEVTAVTSPEPLEATRADQRPDAAQVPRDAGAL